MPNNFPSQQQVANLRSKYPVGTRLILQKMDDPYTKIPKGTKGTVVYVDDAGQIGMNWDNGSSLSLIPGEDLFLIDPQPEIKKENAKPQRKGHAR